MRNAKKHGQAVTFGGGEPTLDNRLLSFLERARNMGIEGRQVETNALRFADPEYVRAMCEAGLQQARVMLPAADEDTWSSVTQLPGALELAWKGVAGLLKAGVAVSVIVPVSTDNVGSLGTILRRLGDELPGVESVQLRPIFFSPDPSGRPVAAEVRKLVAAHVVPIPHLASALIQALSTGQECGLNIQLDLSGGLPLCSLRRSPSALASITGRRVQYSYGSNCGDCAMLERCTGFNPLAAHVHGPYETRPFDRIPPALVRNQNPEPILILSEGMPSYRHGHGSKAEIRVVMPCNQDCGFCFVNREAPNASLVELEQAVDLAVERGVGAVVFTGGEPTLSKHLPALLARATKAGVRCRGIQTNALLLADPKLATSLVGSGLNHAHVSLHSVHPKEYLKITGFGTPEQAAQGVANLAQLGVEVSISLVICQANARSMPETIRYIHETVLRARVILAVAREQQGHRRPWNTTLLRSKDAAHALADALGEASRLGLAMDVAGTCCVPPCVLTEETLENFGTLFLMGHREANWQDRAESEENIVNTVSNDFAETCDQCAVRARCPGITRAYLERHGAAEFSPIHHQRASVLGLLDEA